MICEVQGPVFLCQIFDRNEQFFTLLPKFLKSKSKSKYKEIPLNLVKEVFTAINIFTTNQLLQLATDVICIVLSCLILQSGEVAHTDSKNKATG